ncbi:MAG TPA: deoxynucleoside kinase [Solirubrobacterales bacterium]|nr:deoxynucleoside kinase [Solirubrobacterales bacterium]
MQPEAPFVAVAGSIAVGKSGFVSKLADALGAEALLEEIEANPFFDRFYGDPARWSFHSQMAFAADAMHRQVSSPSDVPVVQDRTVYESLDVFCQILYDEGHLSEADMRIFSRLRNVALSLPRQPTLLVHLHAPTEVIMERITKRQRPAEQEITNSYIDTLNARYVEFVEAWTVTPVIAIDTARADQSMSAEIELVRGTLADG